MALAPNAAKKGARLVSAVALVAVACGSIRTIGSDRWLGNGFDGPTTTLAWEKPYNHSAGASGIAAIPAGDERYWLTRPADGVQPVAQTMKIGARVTINGGDRPLIVEIVDIAPAQLLNAPPSLLMLTGKTDKGDVVRWFAEPDRVRNSDAPKTL